MSITGSSQSDWYGTNALKVDVVELDEALSTHKQRVGRERRSVRRALLRLALRQGALEPSFGIREAFLLTFNRTTVGLTEHRRRHSEAVKHVRLLKQFYEYQARRNARVLTIAKRLSQSEEGQYLRRLQANAIISDVIESAERAIVSRIYENNHGKPLKQRRRRLVSRDWHQSDFDQFTDFETFKSFVDNNFSFDLPRFTENHGLLHQVLHHRLLTNIGERLAHSDNEMRESVRWHRLQAAQLLNQYVVMTDHRYLDFLGITDINSWLRQAAERANHSEVIDTPGSQLAERTLNAARCDQVQLAKRALLPWAMDSFAQALLDGFQPLLHEINLKTLDLYHGTMDALSDAPGMPEGFFEVSEFDAFRERIAPELNALFGPDGPVREVSASVFWKANQATKAKLETLPRNGIPGIVWERYADLVRDAQFEAFRELAVTLNDAFRTETSLAKPQQFLVNRFTSVNRQRNITDSIWPDFSQHHKLTDHKVLDVIAKLGPLAERVARDHANALVDAILTAGWQMEHSRFTEIVKPTVKSLLGDVTPPVRQQVIDGIYQMTSMVVQSSFTLDRDPKAPLRSLVEIASDLSQSPALPSLGNAVAKIAPTPKTPSSIRQAASPDTPHLPRGGGQTPSGRVSPNEGHGLGIG